MHGNMFSTHYILGTPQQSGGFLVCSVDGGAIRPGGLLFLLWHRGLLGRYQCTVKMWIWLNHPKGK